MITASLLAHDRPESEKGKPFLVVKEGMIRLLKDKKVFYVALDTLSKEDQAFVEEIVYAIEEAEEQKKAAAEEKKKAETKKKE